MRRGVSLLVATVCLTLSACTSSSTSSPPSHSGGAADRFLARYVTGDGRVIRHDQGGDIVSEGQAYAMLIAQVAGRPTLVRTIWSWTDSHLRRGDGLLAYHADGSGHVEDNNPAADADVLAAYALLRYRGTHAAGLHDAGRRLAGAVLAHESVTSGGERVIVAGTWATATPATVNPSYLMPSVFAALAKLTGDPRWQQAAATAVTLVRGLTADGRRLPTDWARLEHGGLSAIPDPGGGAPTQYGLDAARLPLWFGNGCTPGARGIASRWWTDVLSRGNRPAAIALSPTGTPVNQATNPVPLLAGAAAAAAAGDRSARAVLHARAARQAHQVPTYYGDAWLALGSALLNGALDPCKEAGGG